MIESVFDYFVYNKTSTCHIIVQSCNHLRFLFLILRCKHILSYSIQVLLFLFTKIQFGISKTFKQQPKDGLLSNLPAVKLNCSWSRNMQFCILCLFKHLNKCIKLLHGSILHFYSILRHSMLRKQSDLFVYIQYFSSSLNETGNRS